jgi:alpha-L-fucosidase
MRAAARFLRSLALFLSLVSTRAAAGVDPPEPYGALPDERHLLWHELEFYGFLHFTTNTFTDKEWGYGDEDPAIFNPADFDADQIVGVCADAGMTGLILTCKHHDGFCLWPSAYTEHDVAASPFRDGKGDVVREISEACARRGLKFGVYLSPWDRNHPEYGGPAYITYYRNQLRELLTNYGPIFEVWWDGANGGDGYYGGARETRRIDRSTYYGWEETTKLVRELQPNAVIFSDAGDVRWVGNERGIAGDPCWATFTPRPRDGEKKVGPGTVDYSTSESGTRNGEHWMPAECDVSIRPGWFYHASQNDQVKSPEQLVDLYYKSVGRGASFLLNVPPDRRGRIHEKDAASLRGFRAILDATFDEDLAQAATLEASDVRGGDDRFAPGNVLDGDSDTYWATDDDVTTPSLVLTWDEPATFNVVSLREHLPLGQRITAWALDCWEDGAWREIAAGQAIGARRLWRGEAVTSTRLRVRVTESPVCPALSEVAVYLEPEPADVRLKSSQAR